MASLPALLHAIHNPPLTVLELTELLSELDPNLEVRMPTAHGQDIPVREVAIWEDEDDPEEEYVRLSD